MAIQFRVLGEPGADNALLVRIDSGQKVNRLLFDCGQDCLSGLAFSEILDLDGLFFSHHHMDHISGFDGLFRCLFNRTSKPNEIWGPPQTAEIMHHRFRGFLWNLHEDQSGSWRVHEIHPTARHTTRFELHEAFAQGHQEEPQPLSEGRIIETPEYTVDALAMDHLTTTIAYIVREQPRCNVDMAKMRELGIKPGAWMQQLKPGPNAAEADKRIELNGEEYTWQALRALLLVETPGDSIAYLTDFLMDEAAQERLVSALQGCQTVICESQYCHADLTLAQNNYHMTTRQAATMAKEAQIETLVLFHLSRRYEAAQWQEMLQEAQAIFPATRFPPHWSEGQSESEES